MNVDKTIIQLRTLLCRAGGIAVKTKCFARKCLTRHFGPGVLAAAAAAAQAEWNETSPPAFWG